MKHSSPPTPDNLVRLDALPQRPRRLSVDRSFPGRIRGASLITTGPAKGHGFAIDRATVEQVARHAEGLRGRWTHGELSADGLGRHLGHWERVHVEPFLLCQACQVELDQQACPSCGQLASLQHRAVGDFAFAGSAHQLRPDGLFVPAPIYLLDRAEEDPRSLGISVVARFEFEADEAEDREPVRRARLTNRRDLLRGDWVADPAANPVGLSAGLHAGTRSPSELTEGAVAALDRIVARVGQEQAKTRALAFLARYFGDSFREELPAEVASVGSFSGSEALRARVDALEQQLAHALGGGTVGPGEHSRPEAQVETYLSNLRRRATELNAPIPATDLALVRRFLEDGDKDTATALANAFLTRSQAAGQVAFGRAGIYPLEAAPDPDRSQRVASAQRNVLRRRGWKVELSSDGTAIQGAERKPRGVK